MRVWLCVAFTLIFSTGVIAKEQARPVNHSHGGKSHTHILPNNGKGGHNHRGASNKKGSPVRHSHNGTVHTHILPNNGRGKHNHRGAHNTANSYTLKRKIRHVHNGRFHAHILPNGQKNHSHGNNANAAVQKKRAGNSGNTQVNKNNNRSMVVGSGWAGPNTCKFAIPYNLLRMREVFRYPITKNDIKSASLGDSFFRPYCKGGYLGGNDEKSDTHAIDIVLNRQYIRKIGLPSNINRLVLDLYGPFSKGYFVGDKETGVKINYNSSGRMNLSYADVHKRVLSDEFVNSDSSYKSRGNFYYHVKGRGVYADGKNNFFYGKKSYVNNALSTQSPVKNNFEFRSQLISGKTSNKSLGDLGFGSFKLTSNNEKIDKDMFAEYTVKPKNVSMLKGKRYKAILVFDMKIDKLVSSNMKVMGIVPVAPETEPVYKEVEIYLNPSNRWSSHGKVLLKNVQTMFTGKALGFRVRSIISGISDSKVYIKSIKEI